MKYTLFDKHSKTGLIEIKIIITKKTLKSCLSRYTCSICAPGGNTANINEFYI